MNYTDQMKYQTSRSFLHYYYDVILQSSLLCSSYINPTSRVRLKEAMPKTKQWFIFFPLPSEWYKFTFGSCRGWTKRFLLGGPLLCYGFKLQLICKFGIVRKEWCPPNFVGSIYILHVLPMCSPSYVLSNKFIIQSILLPYAIRDIRSLSWCGHAGVLDDMILLLFLGLFEMYISTLQYSIL